MNVMSEGCDKCDGYKGVRDMTVVIGIMSVTGVKGVRGVRGMTVVMGIMSVTGVKSVMCVISEKMDVMGVRVMRGVIGVMNI